MNNEDVWTSEGKIDAIKFCKLMSILNETTEKEEIEALLDFMGIRYKEIEPGKSND